MSSLSHLSHNFHLMLRIGKLGFGLHQAAFFSPSVGKKSFECIVVKLAADNRGDSWSCVDFGRWMHLLELQRTVTEGQAVFQCSSVFSVPVC